jgi:hypothetical protein
MMAYDFIKSVQCLKSSKYTLEDTSCNTMSVRMVKNDLRFALFLLRSSFSICTRMTEERHVYGLFVYRYFFEDGDSVVCREAVHRLDRSGFEPWWGQ